MKNTTIPNNVRNPFGTKSGIILSAALLISVMGYGQSNDNCAFAFTLTSSASCNFISGSTLGATESIPPISCGGQTSLNADDIWYKFTAAATTHIIQVVPNDSSFDAIVDVRSGNCNGTNIACADLNNEGGSETVVLSGLTIGNVYYTRIYDFSALCTSCTFQICVTHGTTGIGSINQELPVTILPNPAKDMFSIQLPQNHNEQFSFTLYDAVGKQVKRVDNHGKSGQPYVISIEDFPTGIYFYTFMDSEGKIASGKIVFE